MQLISKASNLLLPKARSKVIVTDRLTQKTLDNLFSLKCMAIHVKEFYPPEECEKLATHLLQQKRRNWTVSFKGEQLMSDVDTVGVPYNINTDDYFDKALETCKLFTEVNEVSLIRRIEATLDLAYKDRCRVKQQNGKFFNIGLPRIMKSPDKKPGMIHVDHLAVADPRRGLFSYNVYLQQPELGGQLLLYPLEWNSRWKVFRNYQFVNRFLSKDPQAQDDIRNVIYGLCNPILVDVQPGDMVILNVQRPHAVSKPMFGKRYRVSVQGFIDYELGKPLQLEV